MRYFLDDHFKPSAIKKELDLLDIVIKYVQKLFKGNQ